jgi:hypothetical protein
MSKVQRCRKSSRPFRDEADRPEIVVQGVDGVVHLEAASRFTGLRTQSSSAQVFFVLLVLGVGAVTGFLVAARGVLVPSDEDAALPVPGVAATLNGCFSSVTVQMWPVAGLLLGIDGIPLPSGASDQRRRGGGVLGVSRSTALRSSSLAAPLVHGSLRASASEQRRWLLDAASMARLSRRAAQLEVDAVSFASAVMTRPSRTQRPPDLRALGDAEGENPQGVAAEGWQRPWGRDRAAL